MTLPLVATSDKALVLFPGWSAPEPETDYIWCDAPVEIGGVVEAGLTLHVGCYISIPDQHVVFELRGNIPGIKRKKALMRIEWRSLRGGHTNRRRKGAPESGKRVSDTHFHPFEANWVEIEQRMREGNLPQAVEIEEELPTFESLREYVGNAFRINNITLVTRPPWVYDLFA